MFNTELTQPSSKRVQRHHFWPGNIVDKQFFRHLDKALVEVDVSVDAELPYHAAEYHAMLGVHAKDTAG